MACRVSSTPHALLRIDSPMPVRISLPARCQSFLPPLVRLYAVASERRHEGIGGAELLVTPTEAVTVAAALLRSQQLTPFEFAIWFSNTRGARGMEEFE